MREKCLYFVFILLLFVFSCSKDIVENSAVKKNPTQKAYQSTTNYKIDSDILAALQLESVFKDAVSIDNHKRIIEKMNLSDIESLDRTDLLLMKPNDFKGLCQKYDCDVTPYLMLELGKTAHERISLTKDENVIKTKTENDYTAKCQALKNLVVSQIPTAYTRAREINQISKDCDCSTANDYLSTAVSNLDYLIMSIYRYESNEYRVFTVIDHLTSGFRYDISGTVELSNLDEKEINTIFSNLQNEVKFWGNSMLPQHLSIFVTCHKTHRCPTCNQLKCICEPTPPPPGPDPWYPGGGGSIPGTPCTYCGMTNCTGQCVADIISVAPNAVSIFKINRDIPIVMWEQMEDAINHMLGGDYLVYYLSKNLREKVSLTLSYNGGCANVFLTNTISLKTSYSNTVLDYDDFRKSLFHIYQYSYYGEYNMSYAINMEFEADTYIYLSNSIFSRGEQDSVWGILTFDSVDVENRYRTWIAGCVEDFRNGYVIGIYHYPNDEYDFLTSYSNAAHARDPFFYQGMKVDVSYGAFRSLIDFFAVLNGNLEP